MISLLEFAESYRKANTTRNAKICIRAFLEFIHKIKRCDEPVDEYYIRLDSLSIQYLSSSPDYADDLFRFAVSLKDIAPTSQKRHLSVVKNWFELNDIVIRPARLKAIHNRLPRAKPITKERDLSIEDIKAIYSHMSLLGRAILLVLLSSGIRSGELLNIRLQDINLDSEPAEITIPEETQRKTGKWTPKNEDGRYTFISPEAVEVIREWLKIRQDWLNTSIKRGHASEYKDSDDQRLFPLAMSTLSHMFGNALRKAGICESDERTGRRTVSAHLFRKYFMSQMKTVMPVEMVEELAGHRGYLSDAYRRYSKAQIAAEYNKAYYAISLYSSENVPVIKAELESTKDTLQHLAAQNIKMQLETEKTNKELEKRIKAMEQVIEANKIYLSNESAIKAQTKKREGL